MREYLCPFLLLIGCADGIEYGVHKPRDFPGEPDGLSFDTFRIETEPWPAEDDSGGPDDPPIDTGTVFDCMDINTPEAVEIDDDCLAEPELGPLIPTLEWEVSTFEEMREYNQVLSSPAIGQLTDDNDDGVIDGNDTPDIIVMTDDGGTEDNSHGKLRHINGDGSDSTLLVDSIDGEDGRLYPFRYGGIALGDVDTDGEPDIITILELIPGPSCEGDDCEGTPPEDHPVGPPPPFDGTEPPPLACYVGAFEISGTLKWAATSAWFDCGGHTPAIADLEGDGTVEIVVGATIVEGYDGRVRAQGELGQGRHLAYEEIGMISSIVDLDGDGRQEIIAGSTIYAPDGTPICAFDDPAKDGYTAAADLDMDGVGEFVTVGNNQLIVAEADCTEIVSWTLPGIGTGGPPTIADFDADGEPEIGVATATHYAVYEPNGLELWSHETTDASSHATGSTVFDFEGDGRPEVVYADETTMWVFDGVTGTPRLEDTLHNSRTLHEYPMVVDVDADGYPEILVPNGGGHWGEESTGLYVLGGDGAWIGGTTVWNQHAFNIVNVNEDLSIPTVPESNWPLHNNFRSGDVNPVPGELATDAVAVAEVCTDTCSEGTVELEFRLGNQGPAILRSDMRLTIYAVNDGELEPISVHSISPPINPGETSEPMLLSIATDQLGNEGLAVSVDDADGIEAVRECNEDNNLLMLPDAICD